MTARISDFLSHFASRGDFSKSSRFKVEVFVPQALLSSLGKLSRDLTFQCEASEIPGFIINTVEGKTYGMPYPVAGGAVSSAELNLTFICSGFLYEKQFFDAWQQYIINRNDYHLRYHDEYVANLDIKSYLEVEDPNNPGNPLLALHIRYEDAFPSQVAPIQVNWSDDQINKLQVTFKYRHWSKVYALSDILSEYEFEKLVNENPVYRSNYKAN